MNIHFLQKYFVQNSHKCNKILNNLYCQERLNGSKFVRRNSLLVPLITYKKCTQDKTTALGPLRRCYCQQSGPPANKLPPLMNFPQIVWPSLFKSFRNFLLATFIIKPYFDNEFTIPDFVTGSKKALEVVSHALSNGDAKDLDGLITSDIVPTLQKTVALMSLSQREQLSIDKDDIYFSFPYQIGVIFKDEEDPQNQKRFVEITMVYHSLKGLATMRSNGEEPPLSMGMVPEYQSKICICNYRFIKEFTKGVEGEWTVNLLNHFRPVDNETLF